MGIDNELCKPNAAILSYPVVTQNVPTHEGSFNYLLGFERDEALNHMGNLDENVDERTCPCFIWHTATDDAVPVANSLAFARALTDKGIKLVSGGTDNHLMLVDLRGTGITGKELEKRLDEVHITLNKNAIPNDPESPFITSGVRIGTPAVTQRGFGKEEMLKIAGFIYDAIYNFEEKKEEITNSVIALCEKFPIYEN